jgi:hypothetical protein
MDLTTAERAVLKQVRNLFGEASVTSYRFASLAARWPDDLRGIYQMAFDSLVKKGLLLKRDGDLMFSITAAALKEMA